MARFAAKRGGGAALEYLGPRLPCETVFQRTSLQPATCRRQRRSAIARLRRAQGLLLDLDGCLVLRENSEGAAGRPLPGATALLAELRAQDLPFVCCTNASGQPPELYAATMRAAGLPIRDHELITPATVAADHLRRTAPDATVMVLGGEGVTRPLASAGIAVVSPTDPGTRADAVLVGPISELTGRAIQVAADAIRGGADFMVTSYVPLIAKQAGHVASVSAAVAAGLAHVTGATPTVLGKPSTLVMEAVCSRLTLAAGDIVVVGDDPGLEVELGRRSGSLTVLVLTGIATADDLPGLPASQQPQLVLSDLVELVELLRPRAR
jgi:HAD superfamily hydrolase (TIGR01450 family)